MELKPRDEARIDPIIDGLRKLWHENPDLRLGQLIINLYHHYGKPDKSGGAILDDWDRIWFMEEDNLLERIKNPPWEK